MENFSVNILGSSSAAPTSRRHTSSQLVNFFHRYYLIDCGEGTQIQLRRKRLKISKIHHIFISHLHGDHFFGLVGLISSLNLFGRSKELHIYSDPRIKDVIDLQLEISETELQFEIMYHPLNFKDKELIFEDKKLEIYSFPLDHRVPTCGFLFKEKPSLPNIKKEIIQEYQPDIQEIHQIRNGGDLKLKNGKHILNKELVIAAPEPRSFAYCSDTKYTPQIHKYFEDVELLYAECTFMKDMQQIAEDKFHMTTSDVSQLAKESNAKKLIVGHFSARYKDMTDFEQELQELHPASQLVNDLEEFHVREI
jgi:ribonuclease Z